MTKQGSGPTMRSVEAQLSLCNSAVELLGGKAAVARILSCDADRVVALCSGVQPLEEHTLREVSRALLRHADRCRKLERQLSPDFSGNLTEAQTAKAREG